MEFTITNYYFQKNRFEAHYLKNYFELIACQKNFKLAKFIIISSQLTSSQIFKFKYIFKNLNNQRVDKLVKIIFINYKSK